MPTMGLYLRDIGVPSALAAPLAVEQSTYGRGGAWPWQSSVAPAPQMASGAVREGNARRGRPFCGTKLRARWHGRVRERASCAGIVGIDPLKQVLSAWCTKPSRMTRIHVP